MASKRRSKARPNENPPAKSSKSAEQIAEEIERDNEPAMDWRPSGPVVSPEHAEPEVPANEPPG